jgi:nucleotide-binding universal stress UspA family protein
MNAAMSPSRLALRAIVHPTDFSERSDFAFRLACVLAHDYETRLIVVHVMQPLVVDYGAKVIDLVTGETRQALTQRLYHLKPSDPNVRVEHQLVEGGDPGQEIVRVARDNHCDLIVMGTHGRTGLGRVLLGSVAEQVLRRASCPVLTVKAPSPSEPLIATPDRDKVKAIS